MESTLVIKVKHGVTLRRFIARVVDEALDLDIVALRKKISSLFNFTPDAYFVLTYVDEDGDIVTLVDDEDLHDVVKQSLNPLRITVKLNSEKCGPHARSSGSPNPRRSPQAEDELLKVKTSLSEVLKHVPEAINLAVKSQQSAPEVSHLISKMALLCMRLGQVYAASSKHDGGSISFPVFVTEDSGISNVNVSTSTVQEDATPKLPGNWVLPNAKSVEISLKDLKENEGYMRLSPAFLASVESSKSDRASGTFDVSVTEDSGISKVNGKTGDVQQSSTPKPPSLQGSQVLPNAKPEEIAWKNFMGCYDMANCKAFSNSNGTTSVPYGVTNKETNKPSDCHRQEKSAGAYASSPEPITTEISDGMPIANDFSMPVSASLYPSLERSYSGSGMENIIHHRVLCDGCGVHPITGSRFKSNVKVNYDLCHICFEKIGNKADYTRMGQPVTYRHPLAFEGLSCPMHMSSLAQDLKAQELEVAKKLVAKLNSCFVLDVNVLDDTIMSPLTPFTKIWRMRNNGSIRWPQGTKIVWIRGDKLSSVTSVELEILADGLPVDGELDIAIDFTAPEFPGRYISHWRMALPSGQKFGQCVWVVIQVCSPTRDAASESLNLNLPPVGSFIPGSKTTNAKGRYPSTDNSKRGTKALEPGVDALPNKEWEPTVPMDGSFGYADVSNPLNGDFPVSDSYPIIDLSEGSAATVPSLPPSPGINLQTPTKHINGNNDVEQTLLKELQEIGFKQVELNREILRMNDYNLEKSVNHLCGVAESEWDPLLTELLEMGFCDEELNKMLMKKNDGSIKRVVMDIISGEKA